MKIPYSYYKVKGGYELLFFGVRVGFVRTLKEAEKFIDKANRDYLIKNPPKRV